MTDKTEGELSPENLVRRSQVALNAVSFWLFKLKDDMRADASGDKYDQPYDATANPSVTWGEVRELQRLSDDMLRDIEAALSRQEARTTPAGLDRDGVARIVMLAFGDAAKNSMLGAQYLVACKAADEILALVASPSPPEGSGDMGWDPQCPLCTARFSTRWEKQQHVRDDHSSFRSSTSTPGGGLEQSRQSGEGE